jgi:hypothetical protein
LFATSAARTVVGTEVGYHPSVRNPVDDIVFASDFISLEDWIAQLSFNRSFPLVGICEKQLMVSITNKVKAKTIRVFKLQILLVS